MNQNQSRGLCTAAFAWEGHSWLLLSGEVDPVLQMEFLEGMASAASEDQVSHEKGVVVTQYAADSQVSQNSEESGDSEIWGGRHTLVLLGTLGIAVSYITRGALPIAIVAMVKTNANASFVFHYNSSDTNANFSLSTRKDVVDVCPTRIDMSVTNKIGEGEFEWDEQTQGMLLSAFFWGYVCTNFLGGRAAEYLGGRLVFGLGILISSLLTIVAPVCARVSKELFLAVRIVTGFAQGVVYPSISTLIAAWVSPRDRSKFVTAICTGLQFGMIFAFAVGGWLCNTSFLGGWPSVFYTFGGLGTLWAIPWFFLIHNYPEEHPRISSAELKYINEHQDSVKKAQVIVSIPWKKILTSPPFWSIAIASYGSGIGFSTLFSGLPTYFRNIQHFDMRSNGLMSALPYVPMWIISILWAGLMNICNARNYISIKTVRRLSMSVASYIPMLAFIAMCFVECNGSLVLLALCVGVGATGASFCGYQSSVQDLAPNLAGTIFGFTNTVDSLTGVLAPIVMGTILQENQTFSAWRTVFLICAGTYFITGTFYVIFIQDTVQPWNEPKIKKGLKTTVLSST